MPEGTIDTRISDGTNGMTDAKTNARILFAEFAVRLFVLGLDLFVLLFLVNNGLEALLLFLDQSFLDRWSVMLILFALYFAVSWMSPLRATPIQFLFGMRVIDVQGETLHPGRAILRALVLVSLIGATFQLFQTPFKPYLTVVALVGYVLVLPALITPNRQAAHDLLAHSIVVNRKALNSPEHKAQLLEHVSDKDPATFSYRRPSIYRMVVDAFVLLVPVVVFLTGSLAANDRNMRSRIAYAYEETRELRLGIEMHYEDYGLWPDKDEEIYVERRGEYPEGGYYELEDDGVIRIRFEVRPELTDGSIVLRPGLSNDEIEWQCRAEGNIHQKYLPAHCRDA